jgi:hypothetical protein
MRPLPKGVTGRLLLRGAEIKSALSYLPNMKATQYSVALPFLTLSPVA